MKRILLLLLMSCSPPEHTCITPSKEISIVYFTTRSTITSKDYVITVIEVKDTGEMLTWMTHLPKKGSYPMFMPVVQVNYLGSFILPHTGQIGKAEIHVKEFVANLFEGAYKIELERRRKQITF